MRKNALENISIFYSYSHKDGHLREKLEKHLTLLKQEGVITGWHDRNISAGIEWEHEIETHLNTAQIILLLISADFLASTYCYSIEMKQAMERHTRGEARVIPIILRPVDWKGAPFSHLQALPRGARPVTGRGWHNQDEAFVDIAQGIRRVVEELHSQDSKVLFEYEGEKQQTKPGGVWISPINGEIAEDIISFAAFAYPTHSDDPPIAYVNFTVGWHGYWQVASTIYPSDNSPVFSSEVKLGNLHLPAGKIQISFDVYDQKGNMNLAPNGVHTVLYQPSKSIQPKKQK